MPTTKESVYITVEAKGVQAAADSMQQISSPLRQVIKETSNLNKVQKDASIAIKTTGHAFTESVAKANNLGKMLDSVLGKLIGPGAVIAAFGYLAKEIQNTISVYDQLHPELETIQDDWNKAKESAELNKLVYQDLAGEIINNTLRPALKGLLNDLGSLDEKYNELFAKLTAKDSLEGNSGFINSLKFVYQANVKKIKEVFNIATDEDQQALDLAFYRLNNSLETGSKKLTDATNRAKSEIDKTKKQIKDSNADTFKFDVQFDWQLVDDKFVMNDIYNKMQELKDNFEKQSASIESISGTESLKNDLRLKLEQEYLAKQHDLEIENAKKTGNDLLIVQDQYDQIKKQKEQESLIAFQELQAEMAAAEKARLEELQRQQAELDKQRNDYIRMFTDNIQGTLTSSVTSFFDAALEGNADLRKSSFEMLSSLAKNIFNMGITKLITYAFEAMMGQYEANSKFGLPGLAIATAASGALAGIMAGMKAKLAPAKIQYSTGGYISAGMVKGAYSSNDSVEALLQPGERVLSKEETKAYDEGFANNRPINFYFTFNGPLQTQAQIDQFTRQVFVPSLRRAAIAGYKV